MSTDQRADGESSDETLPKQPSQTTMDEPTTATSDQLPFTVHAYAHIERPTETPFPEARLIQQLSQPLTADRASLEYELQTAVEDLVQRLVESGSGSGSGCGDCKCHRYAHSAAGENSTTRSGVTSSHIDIVASNMSLDAAVTATHVPVADTTSYVLTVTKVETTVVRMNSDGNNSTHGKGITTSNGITAGNGITGNNTTPDSNDSEFYSDESASGDSDDFSSCISSTDSGTYIDSMSNTDDTSTSERGPLTPAHSDDVNTIPGPPNNPYTGVVGATSMPASSSRETTHQGTLTQAQDSAIQGPGVTLAHTSGDGIQADEVNHEAADESVVEVKEAVPAVQVLQDDEGDECGYDALPMEDYFEAEKLAIASIK